MTKLSFLTGAWNSLVIVFMLAEGGPPLSTQALPSYSTLSKLHQYLSLSLPAISFPILWPYVRPVMEKLTRCRTGHTLSVLHYNAPHGRAGYHQLCPSQHRTLGQLSLCKFLMKCWLSVPSTSLVLIANFDDCY